MVKYTNCFQCVLVCVCMCVYACGVRACVHACLPIRYIVSLFTQLCSISDRSQSFVLDKCILLIISYRRMIRACFTFKHSATFMLQVITMLLEENYSEISTRSGAIKNQSRIVLSESFVQLEASEITKGLPHFYL